MPLFLVKVLNYYDIPKFILGFIITKNFNKSQILKVTLK